MVFKSKLSGKRAAGNNDTLEKWISSLREKGFFAQLFLACDPQNIYF